MKGTFGAIDALLIASALAGSAVAADPASSSGTSAAQPSQPAGGSPQANPKHKHRMGMHHDKAKKPDSNG